MSETEKEFLIKKSKAGEKKSKVEMKRSLKSAMCVMDAHELMNMTRAFDVTAAHQSDAFLLDGLGIKPEHYFKDSLLIDLRNKENREIDKKKVERVLALCKNLEKCIEHLKKNCLEQAEACAQGKGHKIKIQALGKEDFEGDTKDIPIADNKHRNNAGNDAFWNQCHYFIAELRKIASDSQNKFRKNTVTRLLEQSEKILKRSFLTDIKKTFRKTYDKYGKSDVNSDAKSYMQAVLIARAEFGEATKQLSDLKFSLETACQTAAQLYRDRDRNREKKERSKEEWEKQPKKPDKYYNKYYKEYEEELKFAIKTSTFPVNLTEEERSSVEQKLEHFAELKLKNPLLQKLPYYDEMVRQYIRSSLLAIYYHKKKPALPSDAGKKYYAWTIGELAEAAKKGSLNALYKRAKDSISEIKRNFGHNIKKLNKKRTELEKKYHKLTEKINQGDGEAGRQYQSLVQKLQTCLNGYLTPESDLIQQFLSKDLKEKLNLATQQQTAEQALDAPTRTEGVMFGSFHTHGKARKVKNAIKQTFAYTGLAIAWPFKKLYRYPITYAGRFFVWLVHRAQDFYQWCKRQVKGGKTLLPEGDIDELNLYNRKQKSNKYAADLEHYGNFFKLLYCDLFMPHVFIGMINNIFKAAGGKTDLIPDMRWHYGVTGVWNWSDSAMTPIFRLACVEKKTRYFNLRLANMELPGYLPVREEVEKHKQGIVCAGVLDMAKAREGECDPGDLEVQMHLLWVMSGGDDEKLHKLIAAGVEIDREQVKGLFEKFRDTLESDENDGKIRFKDKKQFKGKSVYQYIREEIAKQAKNPTVQKNDTTADAAKNPMWEDNKRDDADCDVDRWIDQKIADFDKEQSANKLQAWKQSEDELEKSVDTQIEAVRKEESDLQSENNLSATGKLNLLQLRMKRISLTLKLETHRYYAAKARDDQLKMRELNRRIADLQYKKTKLRLSQESMSRVCDKMKEANQTAVKNDLAEGVGLRESQQGSRDQLEELKKEFMKKEEFNNEVKEVVKEVLKEVLKENGGKSAVAKK